MVAKKATQSEENINENSMTIKNTTKKTAKEKKDYITIQQSGEELLAGAGPQLTARQKSLQAHTIKNR